MKYNEYAVPVVILAIILTIILPIPSFLLDFLLALNIIITAVILINTIYLENPLQLSIFPSILVITTLFRLSLNVTSTKLILADGNAGKVIEGFGKFVGRNNLVVGFIVFFVITIVNFMVITKGAERIAEVAARFTLDAMPGKQMAIDADLNAGLINDMEAKERRRNVQRESDFYGAMDGASKFVKNDAIAGIIITFLNIIGGIIIGMVFRNEDINYALQKYALLTIGDGLVSQIPALMLSASTSFIVTRAASDSNLTQDLIKQLFFSPRVLFVTSGLSIILGTFLTFLPFLILSIALGVIGYKMLQITKNAQKTDEVRVEKAEAEEIRKPENVVSLLQIDPIEIELGYSLLPMADVNQGGDLLDRVVMIRRQLALELGMIVPIIRLRDNIQLSPSEYVFKIKGVEVARGELMFDHFLAMNPGTAEGELEGIKTTEPAFGLPAIWIDESQRDKAEMLGYTVVDPPSIISTHLTAIIKKHAHELTGRQEVQTLIENVRQNYSAVVEELVPKQMTIGEIQKVLVNLLKEGVSIRDLPTILETLADYITVTRDTDMLTEYVRQALGRAIFKQFLNQASPKVVTLDPNLEQKIMESVQKTEHGTYFSIEPGTINKITKMLSKQLEKLTNLGLPPVVLSSPVVRLYFKRMTEHAVPDLIVLSYNELDPNVQIQSVGTVSI
ncbi:MAG TPA: flagellar biosynthesis protein FlhA [Clostridiaceae bacterium]|nr:flagellar biosynthesis protein FlhA [Clostridiaceae bacterium]